MASYSDKTVWWADWRCDASKMSTVAFPGDGREWDLLVADAAVPAFEVFADLMRSHNYLFRESAGGTYNCRKISGSEKWSLHSFGIAIDLNPSVNPYGTQTHDYPQGFIDDVLATGWFKWGISFDDPMHWEIDVPPSNIGESMHTHEPPRSDLPRDWADASWDKWVQRSGTNTDTRTHDFYREDLSWVYTRVIEPLESKVSQLTDRVRQLEQANPQGLTEAQVKAIVNQAEVHVD